MAFRLKSQGLSFKQLGSSPARNMKTGDYNQSFESPVKHKDKIDEGSNLDPKHAADHNKRHAEGGTHGEIGSKDNKWIESKQSPAKQRKRTEGQDQDKIFDAKGNHIGDWVNGKKVMHNKPRSNEERAKLIKNMEKKNLKTFKDAPAKQTSDTFADGSKKSARDKFNDRETAIEKRKVDREDNQKSQYWYKINNKPATRAEYIKYQNKPGGDEPGKQTNDPNVSLAKQSGNKRK